MWAKNVCNIVKITALVFIFIRNQTPKQNFLSQHFADNSNLLWNEPQSAYFPNDELPPTVSVRISVDWREKDICLPFISNLYLHKSLWRHQQDWTAKSFSRLIIFPFCYCVLCTMMQISSTLVFLSFCFLFFFLVFSYFLHHTGAVKWPIVKEQTVCVWDISGWFSGTLAWQIARQKILNNNWFATCSLRLSSSSFMFL